MIVLTNTGARALVEDFIKRARHLCLFMNDFEPKSSSGASDVQEPQTEEYSDRTIFPADWAVSEDGMATLSETRYEFTRPIGIVHGWAIMDENGALLMAERLAKPFDLSEYGGRFAVTPVVYFRR